MPPSRLRYARCPLSVIPDVCNRESSIFPRPGYTNAGTKEKDNGFPLNPCGNDRWGTGVRGRYPVRHACHSIRHTIRHTIRHSCHPVRYARCLLSVIPDVCNRESRIFPRPGYTNGGTKEKDTGFPLNPCGNDRWGTGVKGRHSVRYACHFVRYARCLLSVIPDVCNRESRIFSRPGHTNAGPKEKDSGFPLKPCGNDRWGTGVKGRYPVRHACHSIRHTIRHSCHPVRYARCPLSVIPDVFNRESRIFPRPGHTNGGTKEKDRGFPLKPCGNDRGGSASGGAIPSVMPAISSVMPDAPLSVIPDVCNRESSIFPRPGYTNEGTKEKDSGFPLNPCGNDRGDLRE